MTDYLRASALHGFADFCQAQSIDPNEILTKAGVSVEVLKHPESLITYQSLSSVLKFGEKISNNFLFSLQFGLYQNLAATIGPILYLMRNSATLGDALKELIEHYELHATSAKVRIEIERGYCLFYYEPIDSIEFENMRHLTELVLGGGLQIFRSLLGNLWKPKALMLQHAPARELHIYNRLLGITPTFNAPHNAWVFDAKLLDTPLSSADSDLKRLILDHIENIEKISVQDMPSHVQQIVRSFLPLGRANMQQVSEYLAISTRSLQRCLANEGTSFNEIVDQTRQSIATRYLLDSSLSFTQLAEILGYKELSTLTRAFNRWYGVSPRKWKNEKMKILKSA